MPLRPHHLSRALFTLGLALSASGCLGRQTERRGGITAAYDGPVIGMTGPTAPRFDGRFRVTKEGARFAWSGSAATIHFRGTSVSADLSDSGKNRFLVLLDGKPLKEKIRPSEGRSTVELIKGLPREEHTLTLYRLTEPLVGETVLHGFILDKYGEALAPPEAPKRNLLIIGDSISTGYGNEANDPALGFDPETENHYLTYGARAARELDASLTTVAWSGRGVYSNRGSTIETKTMLDLWAKTLPESELPGADFDFKGPSPDVVVINLGSNDFAPEVVDPTPFGPHFDKLLREIRNHYPEAEILVTIGPLLSDRYPEGRNALSTVRKTLAALVDEHRLGGDRRITLLEYGGVRADEGLGADYHPTVKTHRRMAAELLVKLSEFFPDARPTK